MAHVKSSTKPAEKKENAPVENAPVIENVTTQVREPEQPKEQKPYEAPKTQQAEVQIPERVVAILRVFSSQEQLYVNSMGGVFSVDTPASLRGDAVLYQNPYFNS